MKLALDEIRAFGANQYQVARRMRALLLALIDDVPERRRGCLREQLALLDDAVSAGITERQRADALVPDRQGLGMGRTVPVVPPEEEESATGELPSNPEGHDGPSVA